MCIRIARRAVWRSFSSLRSGFARSVAVIAGGTIGGQGIILLSAPLLTRLYSPEEMGVLAAYMSLLTMALSFASLRYEMAIPLPSDDQSAVDLIALCFLVLLANSAVLLVPAIVFAEGVAGRLNAIQLRPYVWLLPAGLLAAGIYQILNCYAVRQRAYHLIARTKLSQSTAQVSAQIGLGLLGAGPVGLLVGDVVGRAGGSGTFISLLFKRGRSRLGKVTAHGVRRVAVRYRQFPILSSGSSLMNTAGMQLPPLLLAMYYGPAEAGLFALSQRTVGLPMRLVGQSIAQVYLGEASQIIRKDPDRLASLFGRASRRLLIIGTPPVIGAAVAGPWLFARLFGAEWAETGAYVQALVPAFIAQFVISPLSQTAIVMERQDVQMIADAIRMLLVLGAFWYSHHLGWSSSVAIRLYSGCMFLTYVGYYLLYWGILKTSAKGEVSR